jgi:tight adherence protein B
MDFQGLLIPLLIALAVAGAGFALLGSGEDEARDKRVKEFARVKEEKAARKASLDATARKTKMLGAVKDLEARERQMRKARASLSARIEQAGLTLSTGAFWIASVATGLACGALAFLAGAQPVIALVALLAGGLGLPRWVLGFMIKRRQKAFTSEFANAIEIIVRGVKSGLPLGECLRIIAREAPEPLKSEFARLVDANSMGQSLDTSIAKLFQRMPLPEVNFFGIVLLIQQKAGGNLSEALSNLAIVLRSRKLMREKINALSSEAKASAMIIGSLPFAVMILVSISSPAYMLLLFTDPTGHMGLLIGGTMMGLGILVMRNMINFDI